MSLPLVSILIANYNNKNLLKRSIISSKNQSYPNKEIIVFWNNEKFISREIVGGYLPEYVVSMPSEPINNVEITNTNIPNLYVFLNDLFILFL